MLVSSVRLSCVIGVVTAFSDVVFGVLLVVVFIAEGSDEGNVVEMVVDFIVEYPASILSVLVLLG